jgi:hypothetical protein
MQRIMQAQALGDSQRQAFMAGKKVMEINPRHPLIVGLLEKVKENEEDASAADTARLLFETALLESGYPMQDHQKFASRVRADHLSFNSEPRYNWIYMCLYGKHVNCCILPVNAVSGSYTPSLCNPNTMHSKLQEHAKSSRSMHGLG